VLQPRHNQPVLLSWSNDALPVVVWGRVEWEEEAPRPARWPSGPVDCPRRRHLSCPQPRGGWLYLERREARGGVRGGQEERQGCGKVRCRQGLPGVVGAEEAGKRPACRISNATRLEPRAQ